MSRKDRSEKTRTGHEMSKQYVKHAHDADGQAWRVNQGYIVGIACTWSGVRLVCVRPHYAGPNAEHPWDAAYGWPIWKAATLFAPADEIETAKLKRVLREIRDEAGDFARQHMERLAGVYEELTREPL